MAGPDRKTPDNLMDELAKSPFAYDFYRAVRLLENQRRDLPRVGCSLSPAQDAVRFGQKPSLAFAPSTLESVEKHGEDGAAKLYVRFLGLFGPNSPLPPHLTEYAHERILHYGDRTLAEFLDVFHHRLISFFYRAWATNQKALDMDRADDQRFSLFIGSMFGLGKETENGGAIPDWAKLHFAGRLACQSRSAEGLESILKEYFEVPAQVESFVGHWMDLPADSICELGKSPESGTVGTNAIVGLRIFDAQLKFRIRLGPMKYKDYERLLPNGSSFQRLKKWVFNYCGHHFFWDTQLLLEAGEVPNTKLGMAGRLGWTSWLKTKPFTHDADDLIVVGS